jgi:protein-S-isoprenylcysteine O-methyltransferase Ste14
MNALRQAMHDYVNEVTLGPAPRTDELRRRLREIHAHNTRYFALPVVMLAALFTVALVLSIRHASATTSTAAIAIGFGILVIAMIRLMLSFWREKLATELMIELSELDEDALRKVVARLLKRMK